MTEYKKIRGFDSNISGVKDYIRRSFKRVMYEKVEGNEHFGVMLSRFPCWHFSLSELVRHKTGHVLKEVSFITSM